MIPRQRIDLAELHDWNRKNRRARQDYAARDTPRPSARPCLGCATPTRARDQRCDDCKDMR